jgi:hypothetical protein
MPTGDSALRPFLLPNEIRGGNGGEGLASPFNDGLTIILICTEPRRSGNILDEHGDNWRKVFDDPAQSTHRFSGKMEGAQIVFLPLAHF